MQLIMVDGPDKAGKTTLIDVLSKKFPGLLIKCTDRPNDASKQQKQKIIIHHREIIQNLKYFESYKYVICDRSFFSEMVYSIKRGYDAMKDVELLNLEKVVQSMDHLFVFCNPGEDTLIERIQKEPDEHVNNEENLIMLGRYKKLFERTNLNKIEVDTSRSVESCLKLISEKIYEHKGHKQSKGTQLSLFDTKG